VEPLSPPSTLADKTFAGAMENGAVEKIILRVLETAAAQVAGKFFMLRESFQMLTESFFGGKNLPRCLGKLFLCLGKVSRSLRKVFLAEKTFPDAYGKFF
jgi:hypothetical protein